MKGTRNKLKTSRVENLLNIQDDLLNEEVVDSAMTFYSELKRIIGETSPATVAGLISPLTETLERLDAALKCNADLNTAVSEQSRAFEELETAYKKDKELWKDSFDQALQSEEDLVYEIQELKVRLKTIENERSVLVSELASTEEIIKIMREENLNLQAKEQRCSRGAKEQNWTVPKKVCRVTQNSAGVEETALTNRFSLLDSSAAADIEENLTGPTCNSIPNKPNSLRRSNNSQLQKNVNSKKINKNINSEGRKVLMLTDSHGRNLQTLVQDHLCDVNVCSFVKPGAKINDVLLENNLESFTRDYTDHDVIVVIGGTNDIDELSPFQLSMHKAMDKLEKLSSRTNVVLLEIMKRFDMNYDEEIGIANNILYSRCEKIKNNHRISFVQTNKDLERADYTKHGLHLRVRGKRKLASSLTRIIEDMVGRVSDIDNQVLFGEESSIGFSLGCHDDSESVHYITLDSVYSEDSVTLSSAGSVGVDCGRAEVFRSLAEDLRTEVDENRDTPNEVDSNNISVGRICQSALGNLLMSPQSQQSELYSTVTAREVGGEIGFLGMVMERLETN